MVGVTALVGVTVSAEVTVSVGVTVLAEVTVPVGVTVPAECCLVRLWGWGSRLVVGQWGPALVLAKTVWHSGWTTSCLTWPVRQNPKHQARDLVPLC